MHQDERAERAIDSITMIVGLTLDKLILVWEGSDRRQPLRAFLEHAANVMYGSAEDVAGAWEYDHPKHCVPPRGRKLR